MGFLRFFWTICCLIVTCAAFGQTGADTLAVVVPDTLARDSASERPFFLDKNSVTTDTPLVKVPPSRRQIVADSLKATSDLADIVEYSALDSIVFDVDSGMLYLYRESTVKYQDLDLKSEHINMEMDKQTLHARGVLQPDGTWLGKPEFAQGEQNFVAEGMDYNFKSEKGRIYRGRAIQGDGFLLAEVAKRMPDGSINAQNGRFTTCDLDEPHFYIESKRLKKVGEQLISGPLRFVVAGFPIPVVVPFGFLPNTTQSGQRDGVLMPRYGYAQQRGFFLENFGYYLGLNESIDLSLTGSFYTTGGWSMGVRSSYNRRYQYQGSLGFSYGVSKINSPQDPDFSRTAAWSINWNHNQPINPNTRISGSVNIASSQSFTRRISYNANDYFKNNLNSSINFQKTFANTPFSLNAGASHTQDLNKKTMSMSLPTLALNMNRLTPFQNITSSKLKWLKTVGISYNMQAQNRAETFGDSLFLPILFRWQDTLSLETISGTDTTFVNRTAGSFYKNGLQHSASVSTALKFLKIINIAPSFSYNEIWALRTIRKDLNPETNQIETSNVTGFRRGYTFNGSVSANANFFGIYQLTHTKREITFRQRFTTSLGYGISPDFSDPQWNFYQEVQRDTLSSATTKYSIFEGGVYGGPGQGGSQSVSFSLQSVLEMKYRSKESMEPDFDQNKDKFIRTNILDNLGLNTSYNFAADSFQLAPFNLSARTSLFKNLININSSASVDPYTFGYDAFTFPEASPVARRQNTFMLTEEGKIGRLTRAQISVSTRFSSKKQTQAKTRSADFDETEYRQVQRNLYQYVDFDIPWSLSLNYNFNYNKPDLRAANLIQTANISGDLSFTQKWKVQLSTGYDFVNRQVNNTNVSIYRDLHCWEMSFGWTPFGPLQGYTLTINARSATLKDLRLSRNNRWQDRFQ